MVCKDGRKEALKEAPPAGTTNETSASGQETKVHQQLITRQDVRLSYSHGGGGGHGCVYGTAVLEPSGLLQALLGQQKPAGGRGRQLC